MKTLHGRDAESCAEYLKELHALLNGEEGYPIPPWMTWESCVVYCIETIRNIYRNV